MVELCLMQRASLLQFSKRIADITHETSPQENAKRTARLNKDYLHFINNIHFSEITPQEQGIELYSMLQDHLEIDRDRVELNQEIQELHNYMNILAEAQRSEIEAGRGKALEVLTLIGTLLVVPSFIFGYYGLGILGDNFATSPLKILLVVALILFVVYFSYQFIKLRAAEKNPPNLSKSNFMFGFATFFTLLAMGVPFTSLWDYCKPSHEVPKITHDTIRIGQPLIIPIDSTKRIELNPDNFYFIQPKKQ